MQVHEKIKVLRMFKDWSQEEMAEKLGYSLSGYVKIEHGEVDLSLSTLKKIVELFGIDLAQLLNLSTANVLNVAENFSNSGVVNSSSHYTIVLSESQLAHELEKSRLLLQEQYKEISYLKQDIERLKEIIALLKKDN